MIHMMPKIFIMLPMLVLLLLTVTAVMVLFIKLCSKRPWIGVIAALLFIPLIVFIVLHVSHRPIEAEKTLTYSEPEHISTESEQNPASIWLPGIEDEFEANIYPSRLSAVRSLGLHIDDAVRQVFGDTSPKGIILFQGAHERRLIEEFGKALAETFPDANWTAAPETVAVQTDQVGIRIDIVKVQTNAAPWLGGSNDEMASGTIQACVLAGSRQASMSAEFVEKPWVEDLSGFLNARPDSRFVVAKSSESCMTEAEANSQAIQSACAQIADMLGQTSLRRSGVPVSFARPVDSTDILEGDFILDRFIQSFEGTAGKIWRQALLVDVSAEKLKNLAERKVIIAQVRKRHFAGMFFSIVGLVVLITVVYAFLNAATKGYYTWSLRIAGVIFALVVIILLLV
jgi:hypothetical protein